MVNSTGSLASLTFWKVIPRTISSCRSRVATDFFCSAQARPFLDHSEEKLTLISPLLNSYDIVLIQNVLHDTTPSGQRRILLTRSILDVWLHRRRSGIRGTLPPGPSAYGRRSDRAFPRHRRITESSRIQRDPARDSGWLVLSSTSTTLTWKQESLRRHKIARQGQAKQVIEFVSQHSPSDHAVILMGHFNMGPFSTRQILAKLSAPGRK